MTDCCQKQMKIYEKFVNYSLSLSKRSKRELIQINRFSVFNLLFFLKAVTWQQTSVK